MTLQTLQALTLHSSDFFSGFKKKVEGAVRELNPRPLAPEARIIPLDQRPAIILYVYCGLWRKNVGDCEAEVLLQRCKKAVRQENF